MAFRRRFFGGRGRVRARKLRGRRRRFGRRGGVRVRRLRVGFRM